MLSASIWGVLPALSGYFIMSSSLFIVPFSTSACPSPSAVLGTCEWRQVLTISEWEGKREEETERAQSSLGVLLNLHMRKLRRLGMLSNCGKRNWN